MSDQINLFEQVEHDEEKERRFADKKAKYEKWLTLPEETHIAEDSKERADINNILYHGFCELYSSALHDCETIPDTHRIWLNHNNRDYWVLNETGVCGGERIDICPYCGAELSQGKGNIKLIKAEARHWLFYLHYDIPMRELGYQPPEDREAIRAVWG